MTEPINIKTKKIIPSKIESLFDKSLVLENLEKNILSHWGTWGKFQQAWTNSAYRTFKDLDKYIIMMYLVRNCWQSLSDKFTYSTMDDFYNLEKVTIEKINLIQISQELNIPKETIRRKVNELQNEGILSRKGKLIEFNKAGMNFQKPVDTLELLSSFIEKKSNILKGNDWFGDSLSKEFIKNFVKKYFSVIWLRFFKLQIPFLINHRSTFGDLETWIVWGNIALNHQYQLDKAVEKSVIREKINYSNYYQNVTDVKINRGINAASIADISTIPRATVIRKLKWLLKNEVIKKNKNSEYLMSKKGKLNKKINENFLINQELVAEFLTDVFDYMKNSSFKI